MISGPFGADGTSTKLMKNHILYSILLPHYMKESQEVSPIPSGDHKATRNRQDSMTPNTYNKNLTHIEIKVVMKYPLIHTH